MARTTLLAAVSLTGMALAYGAPALAQGQEASGSDAGDGLEAIVVTARRVSERLQDVPIAVTALSPQGLRDARIQQVSDLRLVTPSLQITPSVNGNSIPGITLRGQRAARTLIGQDPSVAVYFAEVPLTRAPGLDTSTYDLASVQVLKGPQGTLFGRNTTGGALLIVPQRPTFETEGYVRAAHGNYDAKEFEGALNIPMGNKAALRIAGNILRRDGYVTNGITGNKVFDRHSESGRISLLIQPFDTIENVTVFDYYHSNSNGSLPHSLGLFPAGPLLTLDRLGRLQTPAGTAAASSARVTGSGRYRYVESEVTNPFEHTIGYGISNITTIEMTDSLTLKNIFGARHVRNVTRTDFDGTAAAGISSTQVAKVHWMSDELQVIGNFTTFKFVGGVFAYGEAGFDTGRSANFQPAGTDRINYSGGSARNQSYSAYLQADWKLMEPLSLTTGVRYTIDDRNAMPRDLTLQSTPVVNNVCGTRNPRTGVLNSYPDCGVRLNKSYGQFTYNVSLNFKASDNILLYVAHRRGYRSGGFNVRAKNPGDFIPFKPEIVKDLEVGMKSDFQVGAMDGRFNIALYKQWYNQIQRNVTVTDPVTLSVTSVVFNAAKATIEGGEAELTLKPFAGFTLSGFYSYTRPRYQSFINPSNGADLSANHFSDVPEHQGSVTARYAVPVGEGEIAVAGTFYAQSHFELADINIPGFRAPGYHLINARLDWNNVLDTKIDLSLFGQNLANKQYLTSGTVSPNAGYSWAYPGAPRMYGIEARYSF